MFVEVLISAFALLLLWDYLTKKRRNDVLSYMPGPTPLPLVGNALLYRGQGPEGNFFFIMLHFINPFF